MSQAPSSTAPSDDTADVPSFIPALVYPHDIMFSADAPKPHQKSVTVFNPFDFTIYFKVMATQPSRYNVSVSRGELRARASLDIVISFVGAFPSDINEDRFQVTVSDAKNALVGKQVVASRIYPHGAVLPPPSSTTSDTRSGSDEKAGSKGAQSPHSDKHAPSPSTRVASSRPLPVSVILPTILGLTALVVLSPQPRTPDEMWSHYKTLLVAFAIGACTWMFQARTLDRYRALS